MIPSQFYPLPFSTGLDEHTDSRWTQPGTLTGIVNGVFSKTLSISKRFGYQSLAKTILPDAGSVSTGVKLLNLRNDLLLIDGHTIYSRNATIDKWASLDRVPALHAWREPRVEWPQTTANFDIGFNGSHLILVWTALTSSSATNNTVYATVIEYATGHVAFANRVVAGGPGANNFSAVRVITLSDSSGGGASVPYAVVIYADQTSTTNLYAQSLNLNTMVWSAATNIINDFDPTTLNYQLWDACELVGGTGEFLVLYPSDVGGTLRSKLRRINASLSTVASTTWAPPAGHNSPGVAFGVCANSGENVWTAVIYSDGADEHVYVGARDPSGAMVQILAETTLGFTITGTAAQRVGICRRSSTQSTCIFSNGGSAVGARWASITTAGVVSSSARQFFQVSLVGKPFVVDSRCYAGVASLVNLTAGTGIPPVSSAYAQGAYWLIDITGDGSTTAQAAQVVTNLGPRIANTASSLATANFVVTNVAAISTTRFVGVGSFAGSTSTRYSLQSLIYNFADDTYPRWNSCTLGESLYVACGVTSSWDSQRFTEVSFLHPPPTLSLTPSNGAGALTPTGVYTYLGWYEWTNAKGEIQRSASAVSTVTMGAADDTVQISFQHCAATNKQDVESVNNPVISLRLARNQNAGAVFYQIYGDGAAPASLPTTISQNVTDLVSDANLTGLGFGTWPFAGGIVEGYAPPGFLIVVAHAGRVVGLGDDLTTLWFSTEAKTETIGEQVRFSDLFRWVVPGDPITALASMDGTLWAFKAKEIWAISGSGWVETGTQNDLSMRQLVTDQGALDQRGIVVTHQGIYFQSKRGIHLLTRAGEVIYVGAAVEDKLKTYPVIRSSALYARDNQIRWECSSTETATTGISIVYDFFAKAWTTFEFTDTDTPLSSAVAVSTVTVSDRFYRLSSSGRVSLEHIDRAASGAFFDGTIGQGGWVTFSVESCWAKGPGGINGWQLWREVSFVNDAKTPADITVSCGFDYDTDYTESHTFSASDQSAWTTPLKEAQYMIGNQYAGSVRVKMSDAYPTGVAPGTGEGSVYIGLVLDVAVLPGRKRLGPTQSA